MNLPSSSKPSPENAYESSPVSKTPKEELLLQLPGCTVNLVQEGEAVVIAEGYFNLVKLSAEDVPLAILVKVGDELRWPLTKDEPVVKLDELDYLFSLRMEDMNLNYGVSFSQQSGSGLTDLDSFLKEYCCFSEVSSSTELAPRIENYNTVLAKAIPSKTGENVKGIFKLSNAYTKQVTKSPNLVKAISRMTEKRSKIVLNIVEMGTGSAAGPISSHAGKQILATVPGEVVLDSFGAFSSFMDAAEVAEKHALSASSKAATKMVKNRFGESEGEATEDVFAIAGHASSTDFNIVKIRQAINPASSVSSTMAKNAIRKNL
ncbi:hypothetical protein MKX01_002299 [Papaver californicum]|nr:hypothetical protein MKX01_002299 [Papaver californicum]